MLDPAEDGGTPATHPPRTQEGGQAGHGQPTTGIPWTAPPTRAPSSGAQIAGSGDAPWTGGGAITTTTGRVFFTYQGRKTDAVGGQGVAFDQPRRQQMHTFGYPAAAPYDGAKLIYCSGRTFDDVLMPKDQGLTCDMTGPSFDEKTGLRPQNSVNSFKYNFAPNWMFGPYFGAEAQAVHQAAQSTNAH